MHATPRDVYLAPQEWVDLKSSPITALNGSDARRSDARHTREEAGEEAREDLAAVGRVSARAVCIYPPGIPLLVPGQVVTRAAAVRLLRAQELGATVTGCNEAADGGLQLRVLLSSST